MSDRPSDFNSDILVDPTENERIRHLEATTCDTRGIDTSLDPIEAYYLAIAPHYDYDPLTGTLVSHRKPSSAGRHGTGRKEPSAKVITHHPNKTIQIQSGGRTYGPEGNRKGQSLSGSRRTINLSPLKLCFLKAYGWVPSRVYTLNGDRTDWRAANLSSTRNGSHQNPQAEEASLFDSIRFAKSSVETEEKNNDSDSDLFSNTNLEEPNE